MIIAKVYIIKLVKSATVTIGPGIPSCIINSALAITPNTSVLIVSTMLPNPNATNGWYGTQRKQPAWLSELAETLNGAGTPCAMVNMTEMSKSILETKDFMDCTGNNINETLIGRVMG